MKTRPVTIICSALIGLAALSSHTVAQQKTVKGCEEEWRANRAENQAKGITEKAYVAQCRAGSAAAQPTAPVAPTAAKPAPPAAAAAPKAAAQAATPSSAKSAPAAVTTPTGANQFSTEALAKARCPTDTVVWVNLTSRIYHFARSKNYGKTTRGAYMCEKDTAAASFRAAKNEKHPS
jgi:hypothetical protein